MFSTMVIDYLLAEWLLRLTTSKSIHSSSYNSGIHVLLHDESPTCDISSVYGMISWSLSQPQHSTAHIQTLGVVTHNLIAAAWSMTKSIFKSSKASCWLSHWHAGHRKGSMDHSYHKTVAGETPHNNDEVRCSRNHRLCSDLSLHEWLHHKYDICTLWPFALCGITIFEPEEVLLIPWPRQWSMEVTHPGCWLGHSMSQVSFCLSGQYQL